MKTQGTSEIDVYLEEYTRDDIIAKYISRSAGDGIAFVLSEVYAPIYLNAIRDLIANRPKGHRFRVMEYGCGGGMNLLKIIELLRSQSAELERGYGTDFSPPMVEAARNEAAQHLPKELNAKLTYVVANNETLTPDLARNLSLGRELLDGTFDLIVGVNTTRYAHRLKKEKESTRDIFNLLRPGGYSIMIDMNQKFPFFRSKIRDMFKPATLETYVPSLSEYRKPFTEVGFNVKDTRNFCWIPHSANSLLLSLSRTLSPVLDAICSPFAMRSLVVAQKPK